MLNPISVGWQNNQFCHLKLLRECQRLKFTTLWANSADDILLLIFPNFIFPRKEALTFDANYLQIASNVSVSFLGKKWEKYVKIMSAEFFFQQLNVN